MAGTGLDAWIVQRDVQDPAEYAETWSRDGGHHSATTEFATMYAAWLDDFASRGVSAHRLRRHHPAAAGGRARALRRRSTEATGPVAAPMGPHVLSGLRARTWLAEHTDDELLAVAWRCADDVTEERHGRPGDEDPAVILLRQGGGLRRVVRLDTVGAALVSVCDGSAARGGGPRRPSRSCSSDRTRGEALCRAPAAAACRELVGRRPRSV